MINRILIFSVLTLLGINAFAQNNLSLSESKKMAIENNVAIKNSSLEIDAAKETKKEAYTNFFPKVSATLGGMKTVEPLMQISIEGGNLPVYDGNPANIPTATEVAYFPGLTLELWEKGVLGSVSIMQPIYVGGKIKTGNKLAQLNIDAKEEQKLLAEDVLLLKVEKQYWQLVSLQEKQKTLDKYELLLNGALKQANDAFNAGLIIKNDILKVQLKQSELEINKSKLKNGKQLALMQFCHTIGIPYDATLVFNESSNIIENPDFYYVDKELAIKSRTEYSLLEKSVKAKVLQTEMTRGDYLPQAAVGVNAFYGNAFEKTLSQPFNAMVYATVTIPISDWWGGSYKIKEHEIQQKIAQNTFDDTKGLLKLQTQKLWVDLNQAYEQIAIMEKSVIQANENLKVSSDGYKNGIVTITDLLEAQAILNEINSKLIDARVAYVVAVSSYKQVTNK